MANVLPKKDRIALRRRYRLRLAISFTFVITAAMIIGVVSLVPAYLAVRVELSEAMRFKDLQNETREVSKQDAALETARLVNAQINALMSAETMSAAHAIEYVMRDWEIHAEDIIISGFSYDLSGPEEEVSQLRVSGEARDREAFNAFVQTLRSDSMFSEVTFPVSDLAGGDTIDYSVVVKFKS